MNSPSEFHRPPTRLDTANFLQWLALLPALSAMVWLRRGIGYRTLDVPAMGAAFLLLFLGSFFLPPSGHPRWLAAFAATTFAYGHLLRLLRWWQFRRQVRQHSYFLGISRFERAWMPAFMKRHHRVARFVDPLACWATAWPLLAPCPALGIWLLAAGACLAFLDWQVYFREAREDMDMVDGLIISEVKSDVVQSFDAPGSAAQDDDAPLPTGLGNDIQPRQVRTAPAEKVVPLHFATGTTAPRNPFRPNPWLAAAWGLVPLGVGLAIYLRSARAALLPLMLWIVAAVVSLPTSEAVLFAAPLACAVYGYWRAGQAHAALHTPALATGTQATSIEARLEKLNALFDKKLVTQAEYDAKRERILGEL